LDKWLWAARFFKTRQIAHEAVAGGKVELNGQRTKPAHPVRAGDRLRIRQGPYLKEILVQALSDQRGPADSARNLYAETEASLVECARLREILKDQGAPLQFDAGRPKARDRRFLRRLRRLAK
jgi:ribosome-associated heat shock protein Hsp15